MKDKLPQSRALAVLLGSFILISSLEFSRPYFGDSALPLLPSTTVSASESNASPEASRSNAEPGNAVALVLISLVIILMVAKLGGAVLERLGQPAVLGELIFGVIVGNLSLLGFQGLEYLKSNEAIGILAEIGVIFLLFEVGLESNIKQMLEVGASFPSLSPCLESSCQCCSAGVSGPFFCLRQARWSTCSLARPLALPAWASQPAF